MYFAGDRLLTSQSLLTDLGVKGLHVIQEALRYPLLGFQRQPIGVKLALSVT